LSEADTNCSDVISKFLVKNYEEILASVENSHEPTTESTTTSPSVIPEAPTSSSTTTTILSEFTIDFSNNELDLEHCMLGGSDLTAFFRQYQNHADKISKPITLETKVQELLALGDVLALAKNQHSNIKISFFGEELLDKLLDNQKQVLLNKIPDMCPGFTKEVSYFPY
jgi:hypothetical protein